MQLADWSEVAPEQRHRHEQQEAQTQVQPRPQPGDSVWLGPSSRSGAPQPLELPVGLRQQAPPQAFPSPCLLAVAQPQLGPLGANAAAGSPAGSTPLGGLGSSAAWLLQAAASAGLLPSAGAAAPAAAGDCTGLEGRASPAGSDLLSPLHVLRTGARKRRFGDVEMQQSCLGSAHDGDIAAEGVQVGSAVSAAQQLLMAALRVAGSGR